MIKVNGLKIGKRKELIEKVKKKKRKKFLIDLSAFLSCHLKKNNILPVHLNSSIYSLLAILSNKKTL